MKNTKVGHWLSKIFTVVFASVCLWAPLASADLPRNVEEANKYPVLYIYRRHYLVYIQACAAISVEKCVRLGNSDEYRMDQIYTSKIPDWLHMQLKSIFGLASISSEIFFSSLINEGYLKISPNYAEFNFLSGQSSATNSKVELQKSNSDLSKRTDEENLKLVLHLINDINIALKMIR